MNSSYFSRDIQDLLCLLYGHRVRYLIVGAEAVIFHGFARLTGDIDVFFEPSAKNCQALFSALREFWGGEIPGIGSPGELASKGMVFQFGQPPNRIDLVNSLSGVGFAEAWHGRASRKIVIRKQTITIHYIGLSALIKNKEACGRPKDLEDLKYLREAAKKR
jgi:hypothetical protein